MALQLKIVIFGCLIVLACNKKIDAIFTPTPKDQAINHFSYASYDTNNTLIVQGVFTLNSDDSTNITGEWDFDPVGNPQNIGPQTGEGNLIGGYIQDSLWVELRPNWADNNLQLIGKLEGVIYEGRWVYSSFIGPTNWGTFKADLMID